MNNSTRNFTNSSNAQNSSSFKDKLRKLTTGVALAGTLMVGNPSCTSCSHEKNIDQEAKAENVEVKAEGKDTLTDEKTVAFTDVQESSQTKETAEEEEAPLNYEKLMEGAGMGDELREIEEQEKLREEYEKAKRKNIESSKRLAEAIKGLSEEQGNYEKKKARAEAALKEMEWYFLYFSDEQLLAKGDLTENLELYFSTCKLFGRTPIPRALELKKVVNGQKASNK